MTKIGFITTNKLLGQSLSAAINAQPELDFESYLLLNLQQAALDIDVLKIDVAIVDVLDAAAAETKTTLELCEKVRRISPNCRILLFLYQDDTLGKQLAVEVVRAQIADDFVFYDTSLEYLFAKLSAL